MSRVFKEDKTYLKLIDDLDVGFVVAVEVLNTKFTSQLPCQNLCGLQGGEGGQKRRLNNGQT